MLKGDDSLKTEGQHDAMAIRMQANISGGGKRKACRFKKSCPLSIPHKQPPAVGGGGVVMCLIQHPVNALQLM